MTVKPPAAHPVEMALLAALLQQNAAYWSICNPLIAENFADVTHGAFFEEVSQAIESGAEIDPQRLAAKFPGELDRILDLGSAIALPSSAGDYAETILDYWSRRRLIEISSEAAIRAADTGDDSDAADWLEARLGELASGRDAGRGLRIAADAATEAIAEAEAIAKGERPAGILTGIGSLNGIIGGLRAGQLIILAGRTSMGKTAFGIDIADRAAAAGNVVAYFSLEMSATDIGEILLARRTGIPARDIANGHLDRNQFETLTRASGTIKALPLHIDDSPGLGMRAIRARARRLQNRDGLGLVIVDYLQMMRSAANDKRPRYELLGEISRGLKELAKELGVPVVALAQVSRAVENRDNKRPSLADLRESGDIEQDSDVVIFLYREDYYLRRETPDASDAAAYADWSAEMARVEGQTELIVSKQRKGPTGTTYAQFDAASGQFTDRGERAENLDMGV